MDPDRRQTPDVAPQSENTISQSDETLPGQKLTVSPAVKPLSPGPSSADSQASNMAALKLLRKRGTGRNLVQSVTAMINMRRVSRALGLLKAGTGSSSTQTKPKLENTFKITPDNNTQFCSARVTKVVQDLLMRELQGQRYDPSTSKGVVSGLSTRIKDKVKDLNFQRYKIVCNVIIGQNKGQGFELASRCLWSSGTDNWACASYKNDSLFVIAMVHGTYYEWFWEIISFGPHEYSLYCLNRHPISRKRANGRNVGNKKELGE